MYIGIDLGGTRCRIGASNKLDRLTNFVRKDFLLTHDFEKDFATIVTIIHKLSQGKVQGIGIGTPGAFDKDKTMITSNARNIQEWINKPITKLLNNIFNCSVSLENDGVTAALGEAYFGENKHKEFVYVIWGTGVGGAKVNWQHDKAEVQKLDWYEYFETWEQSCGGNAIKKNFGKPAEMLSENEWQEVMQSFSKEFNIFLQKQPTSLVVFGGGIAIQQAERLKNLNNPLIKISQLGDNAGLHGALSLLAIQTN